MQNQIEAPKVQKPAKENPETVILRALNSGNQKVRKYLLDEVFYEPPVGVREFLRSPDYFNLEGVMYESIMQLLEYVGQPEIREAVLEIGRGSGKSYGCSGYLGYQEYWLNNLRHPQLFYDKAPSTLISCLNVSISASQAESVIFGDLAEMIGNSKWFKGNSR